VLLTIASLLRKPNTTNESKETSRLEAFSDGVFAIAITLLILELIQILDPRDHHSLVSQLFSHWQALAAFGIGFLTILICWINHHLAFLYIKRLDTSLFWANGFVLLVVTLTPFPTAILAEYFEQEPKTALSIFGINYFLMSLAAYSIMASAYKNHLVEEQDRPLFHNLKSLYGYAIIYTFLAFFVCLISVLAGIACFCILFLVFAFPEASSRRLLSIKKRSLKRAARSRVIKAALRKEKQV
jgi:uncharacterized membrane protein